MATMATSMLNIPVADDTMEISSDAGPDAHDVDVDSVYQQNDPEIDYMLEDADPDSPPQDALNPSNDDLMFDDLDEITYVEEPMQDDDPDHVEDINHSLDVDVDIEFEQTSGPNTTVLPAARHDTTHTFQEQEEETLIDYDAFSETEDQALESTYDEQHLDQDGNDPDFHIERAEHSEEQLPAETEKYVESTVGAAHQESEPQSGGLETVEDETIVEGVNPTKERSPSASIVHSEPGSEDPLSKTKSSPPLASLQAEHAVDAAGATDVFSDEQLTTADSTHDDHSDETQQGGQNVPDIQLQELHAVTVIYNDAHMSLFPPYADNSAETFLLADSMVAHGTLLDLFRACRRVLDQDVDEDSELEIYCENLDLTIAEDSIHCMTTSLAQIIDVYVNLMHNDGVENPGPLSIYLTTKSRFSAQLTNLFKAVSDRKGLSQLALLDEQSLEGDGELSYHEVHESDEEKPNTEKNMHAFDDVHGEVVKDEATETDENADNAPAIPAFGGEEIELTDVSQAELSNAQCNIETSKHGQESVLEEAGQLHPSSVGPENSEESQHEQDRTTTLLDVDTVKDDSIEYTEDAEQGDGGSSGSSTVQGETRPMPQSQYAPNRGGNEWLIDFSDDEDLENDTSLGTVPTTHEQTEEFAATGQDEYNGSVKPINNAGLDSSHTEIRHEIHEYVNEFDDSTQVGDVSNQAWDEEGAWAIDFDEQPTGGNDHEDADESWDLDDDPLEAFDAITAPSGLFQVPEGSLEDEDEITYNDENGDDLPTSAAKANGTDHERSPNSPLGKRSREDDEGAGWLDGSDQDSKRLKL